MTLAACPESPTPWSSSLSVFVPRLPPIMKAAITNASQPKMAILRWRALQRPARAAMELERTEVCPPRVECCIAQTVPTGRRRGDAAAMRRALGVVPRALLVLPGGATGADRTVVRCCPERRGAVRGDR